MVSRVPPFGGGDGGVVNTNTFAPRNTVSPVISPSFDNRNKVNNDQRLTQNTNLIFDGQNTGYSMSPQEALFQQALGMIGGGSPEQRQIGMSLLGIGGTGGAGGVAQGIFGNIDWGKIFGRGEGEGGGGWQQWLRDLFSGVAGGTDGGVRQVSSRGRDSRQWGSSSGTQEQAGWKPAMDAIEGQMPNLRATLGKLRSYSPTPDGYQLNPSANYKASLNRAMTARAQANPHLDTVADQVADRADLAASLGGRYGSAAHGSSVARALAGVRAADFNRMQSENLQRDSLALGAGAAETGIQARNLGERQAGHVFRQNEPILAYNRSINALRGLAALGSTTSSKNYWDQANKGAIQPLRDIYGSLFGG